MTTTRGGINRFRRSGWLLSVLTLVALLAALGIRPAAAQLFGDRPPPVPPASVPDPGAAVSLAPPSGPASGPPPLPTAPPSVAALPPVSTPATPPAPAA